MSYPVQNIEDIMPDVLLESIEKKMGSDYRFCIGYFMTGEGSALAFKKLPFLRQHTRNTLMANSYEAAKGILPPDMFLHPSVCYNYRGGNIILNGLDQSSNSGVVYNGTWQP